MVSSATSEKQRSEKLLECNCGCGGSWPVKELTAIETYWHEPPRGCSEGDNWLPGELQFVCPETGVINRLLFNNDEVPWEKRKEFMLDPEAQFKRMYLHLFKEVLKSSEGQDGSRPDIGSMGEGWQNNYTVDLNRGYWGLVEKGAVA